MESIEKLIAELRSLSMEDLKRVIDSVRSSQAEGAATHSLLGIADVGQGRETDTRIIVMDRKMQRGVRAGEEGGALDSSGSDESIVDQNGTEDAGQSA